MLKKAKPAGAYNRICISKTARKSVHTNVLVRGFAAGRTICRDAGEAHESESDLNAIIFKAIRVSINKRPNHMRPLKRGSLFGKAALVIIISNRAGDAYQIS